MKLIKELYGATKPYEFLFRCSTSSSMYDQYLEACNGITKRETKFIFEDETEITLNEDKSQKVLAMCLMAMVSPMFIGRLFACCFHRVLETLKTGKELELFNNLGETGSTLNQIMKEVIYE